MGIMQIEKDENDQLDVASDYVGKSSLQDYSKLEKEVKSPKTPMSPRELFFIDLIREAEKAESAKLEKIYFFPNETTQHNIKSEEEMKNKIDTTNEEYIENIQDANEKNEKINKNKSKCESNYFIANVENPESAKKAEMFLQIDSM
ncbi:hypothetical protein EAI_17560 [Harpegnathos saltator]|uniref:Uncharacterized protein n=2 Tax=Harpegnathos saltator TaxID=610380 RepID=E2BCK8_HARSA|nr:hypothetical protein EAI_17560 [Harpegnathos saltator]